MVKPTWGTKRTCQNCAARFYDLNKSPIKCPKCGREHDREDFVKVRRGRGASAAATAAAAAAAAATLAAAKAAANAKKAEEANGDELPVEADADGLEDTTELEDDDIEVVVEDKEEGDR